MKKLMLFSLIASLSACSTQWGDGAKFSMLEDRKLLLSNIAYLNENKANCNNYYYEWKEEYAFDSIKAFHRNLPIPEKPMEVELYQQEMAEIERDIQLNKKELDSIEIQLSYKYGYSF
jgi:pyruvate/2-oxoacid:ferredoxin oxidoreductase beta subunit